MAEKDLKRLSRGELVEIIYQLKTKEEQLLAENAELKRKLEEREIKIENVGSLAEAALVLSDIFSAAEESVAMYVDEIKRRYQRTQDANEVDSDDSESDEKSSVSDRGVDQNEI